MLTANQVESIRECVTPLRPAAAYLFGSAATGRLRADSDLDLAILPGSAEIMPLALYDMQVLLAEKLGLNVDLVDLARATTV